MPSWINLESTEQVDSIITDKSKSSVCVLFKHSTTCSISNIAKLRLDDVLDGNAKWYYLDLLSHRNVSNYIAETLEVHHESPQVIIVKDGEVIYDESHLDITVDEVTDQLTS